MINSTDLTDIKYQYRPYNATISSIVSSEFYLKKYSNSRKKSKSVYCDPLKLLKIRWGSCRYRRTTELRFFCNHKTKKPMNIEKGINIHNKAFGLTTHDLFKYPNCCSQNTHFFSTTRYNEKNLYYGVYKYNRKSKIDIKNVLNDGISFINDIEISCKQKKILLLHYSKEPLHIWAKKGDYSYLEELNKTYKLLEKITNILKPEIIEKNIDYWLDVNLSKFGDFHILIEITNTTKIKEYSVSFYI